MESKNNFDPLIGGMNKNGGSLVPPVAAAVDRAASVCKISSVIASVSTSMAAISRSPDMPVLESETEIKVQPECRDVREPPRDDVATDNGDSEDLSCAFICDFGR